MDNDKEQEEEPQEDVKVEGEIKVTEGAENAGTQTAADEDYIG